MKSTFLVILVFVLVFLGWFLMKKPSSTPIVINPGISNSTSTSTSTNTNSNVVASTTDFTVSPNSIVIDMPRPGATIVSPISVSGRARGSWFFEASAPVYVRDASGATIGQGYIQAVGEWMTTDFVPFTGSIAYTRVGTSTNATLVFMNDNPSGDPAREVQVTIPIYIK